MHPNLELLIEEKIENFREFEAHLFRRAIEVTATVKQGYEQAVENLRQKGIKYVSAETIFDEDDSWLPRCKYPELLFKIYLGDHTEQIVRWTRETGQHDIRALRIPIGLSYTQFKSFIGETLIGLPLIQNIYEYAKKPINIELGCQLITGQAPIIYNLEEHWRTLRDWLLHFLPNLYRMPSETDTLLRGTVIGSIHT